MLSTLTLSARAQPRLNRWRRSDTTGRTPLPACTICNRPVQLETSKTDENGRAVHEECYVLKIRRMLATMPSPI
jgi:hypothetical protein